MTERISFIGTMCPKRTYPVNTICANSERADSDGLCHIRFMDKLGKTIRHYRKAARLSQAELAERVGYGDHSPISKIEAGTQQVTATQLEAIAAALEIESKTLLDAREDPYVQGDPSITLDIQLIRRVARIEAGLGFKLTDRQFAAAINVLTEDAADHPDITDENIRTTLRITKHITPAA